jgi:2-hydroxy-6-oxonona-2,4-dienedioate hydrolase
VSRVRRPAVGGPLAVGLLLRRLRRRAARWRAGTEARLRAGSRVVETVHGPVEYGVAEPDGSGEAASPLLVLHGTAGGYPVGLVLGRALAASCAEGAIPSRIVAPSRPGYLRTPLSTGRTFAEQAEAIAALLDALAIERAAIVGVSSGALPALELALRATARVERLVLWAGVTCRFRPDVAQLARGPLATDLGAQLALRALAVTARLRLRHGDIHDPRALATLRELGAASFPLDLCRAGMRNDDAQVAALPDLSLERLRVPTLIVHGTADRAVPFANAARAAQRIPAARLVPVAGADHALTLVAPDALGAIAEFLASTRAA